MSSRNLTHHQHVRSLGYTCSLHVLHWLVFFCFTVIAVVAVVFYAPSSLVDISMVLTGPRNIVDKKLHWQYITKST